MGDMIVFHRPFHSVLCVGNTESRKETSGVDIGNILGHKVILVGGNRRERD